MSDPAESPSTQSEAPSAGRRVAVYVAVGLTVVLVLGLILSTGIRWFLQPMPSSYLIIHATPQLAGATITVIGGEGGEARRAKITAEHGYATPLFLEAGSYAVRIEKDGRTVFTTDKAIYISEGRRYDIDLTHPTTRHSP